jgi:hypothetical protein
MAEKMIQPPAAITNPRGGSMASDIIHRKIDGLWSSTIDASILIRQQIEVSQLLRCGDFCRCFASWRTTPNQFALLGSQQ